MKRILWLDSLKGIAIILVVIGHILPQNSFLTMVIYTFHMPLFFIITGVTLFLCGNENSSVISFIVKKGKALLYPYFTFSAFTFIYMLLVNGQKVGIQVFVDTIDMAGYGPLWFLPALFISETIFKLLTQCSSGKWHNIVQQIILLTFTAVICG